jgi:hypothetical protein
VLTNRSGPQYLINIKRFHMEKNRVDSQEPKAETARLNRKQILTY